MQGRLAARARTLRPDGIMPDTKFDQAQETDLTLWADSVARNLDEEGHADLAMLFRALVRRDGDGVQDALDRMDFGALDGLIETLGVEIDERLEAGEERFAEIIDEVLEFAVEALERAIDDDIEWDEGAPSA